MDASASISLVLPDGASSIRRRAKKWNRGESEMIATLADSNRLRDMAVVRKRLGCEHDVSEVYSPPRAVTIAEAAGLRGGFSMDLTAPGPDGKSWDFTKVEHRKRALALVRDKRPYLLIGSPPCTAWSNLQNLNRCKPGGNEKVDAAQAKARVHLEFCCQLYREQIKGGRYFLREHLKKASSWKVSCIQELASSPMVFKAEADQCAYGLMSKDSEGEAPAKKPTTFMTNSVGLQRALSNKCPGCIRHVQLVEGRASAAQTYPKNLCRSVTAGIIEQARLDARDMFSMKCVGESNGLVEIDSLQHEQEDWRKCWDDLSGEQLDTKLTREARHEEVEAIHSMKVYVKVSIDQCLEEAGKRPIGTRWVVTNKGDKIKPKIR